MIDNTTRERNFGRSRIFFPARDVVLTDARSGAYAPYTDSFNEPAKPILWRAYLVESHVGPELMCPQKTLPFYGEEVEAEASLGESSVDLHPLLGFSHRLSPNNSLD